MAKFFCKNIYILRIYIFTISPILFLYVDLLGKIVIIFLRKEVCQVKVNFNEAIYNFYNYVRFKNKSTTYSSIKYRIDKYILPYFNNKNLFDLTKKDYLEWQYYINTLELRYNYKSSLHCTFSKFLNFCIIYYDLPYNVATIVGNFKNNDIENYGDVWTIQEFNQFISVIDNLKYKVIFELLYFTGMRKGEVLALKWEDIDFNKQKISINKTITRTHELQTPKTKASNRIISIPNYLISDIFELKKNSEDDLVFNDITFTTLLRKKNYYCELANVKRIKIHELRHSHAYFLFDNNVPIDEIKYRLGHSKISMTMDTYLRFIPINEKNVISTLSSINYF